MYMLLKPLLSKVMFEDAKVVIRRVNQSSTDNVMVKRKGT